jgi:hypothetical protein
VFINSLYLLEWLKTEKRNSDKRTVMIDGHSVLKESLGCGQWEARPSLAVASHKVGLKRSRRKFENESVSNLHIVLGSILKYRLGMFDLQGWRRSDIMFGMP